MRANKDGEWRERFTVITQTDFDIKTKEVGGEGDRALPALQLTGRDRTVAGRTSDHWPVKFRHLRIIIVTMSWDVFTRLTVTDVANVPT